MSSTCASIPPNSLLIVEDCQITLNCYVTMFRMMYPKFTIYPANDGTIGLELFKIHMPDIVITDLHMAEMGGKKLAECIHALKPETKLIAITGYNDMLGQNNIDKYFSVFDHIIEKPVDFEDLVDKIEQCANEINIMCCDRNVPEVET